MKISRRTLTGIVLLLFTACRVASAFAGNEPVKPYDLLRGIQKDFEQGLYEQAEKKCVKALNINPRFYPAYNILGAVYSKQEGAEMKAVSCFEKSLALAENQPLVYNEIAALCRKTNKLDKAILYLKKGLEFDPEHFQLNYNLALLYFTKKDDPFTAIDYFMAAKKKEPSNVRLLFMTGFCYIFIGERPQVLEYITRLRELKEELMAVQLENILRKKEEGEQIDTSEETENYDRQVSSQVQGHPAGARRTSLSVGQPTTRGRATGQITVQRTYRQKQ